MNKGKLIFALMLVTIAGLFVVLFKETAPEASGKSPLVLHCAAGMRKPVTTIIEQYRAEYGVEIDPSFEGSGTLLSKLRVGGGDLYLAAASDYVKDAQDMGLVKEALPVSYLTAGIGVAKGNPKNIHSLADLQREDVKIAMANPEAAAVGKFTRKVLRKHGLWDTLAGRASTMTGTVNELANAIRVGGIDAVILWDALAAQVAEVDFVHVPEFDAAKRDITIGVLTRSEHPTEALRFARYLCARDRGLKVFEADGYEILEGDAWAERPNLLLYSGAMLRPAISRAVEEFQEREGVDIDVIYNGCGILVSQMRAGENPDAYFSCDVKFMEMVQERFEQPVTVAANDMVLVVAKDNPRGIQGLGDLARTELRKGIGHPDKSALGFLTRELLVKNGLYDKIRASNNLVDSPTGDFLVNQLRANSLDVIIVYRSNARAHPKTLEQCAIIEIDDEAAVAEQPYAVGVNSKHKHLLNRLRLRLLSEQSRADFESFGFNWLMGSPEASGPPSLRLGAPGS